MTKQVAIKDPPEKCPYCFLPRAGIQEGVLIFTCGTFLRYSREAELKQTTRSSECQKKTEK
jgi:hypothetical protein